MAISAVLETALDLGASEDGPPPGPSAVFHAAENGRRKRLGRRKAWLGSGSAGKKGATRAGRWQGAACGPAGPRTGPVGGCGATWPCGALRGLAVVSGVGCRLTRVSPSGALGKALGARSRRPRAHEGHEGAVCKLSRYVVNYRGEYSYPVACIGDTQYLCA